MQQTIVATRAIAGEPSSLDREARTVEVIWTTGARSPNWVQGLGNIIEELDLSAGAVRMDLLQSGASPVLDTHARGSARGILGRITSARLEPGRGVATLKFSTAPDVDPIWQRIEDGSLRSVSVGYRVYRYDKLVDPVTKSTVYRAVDWEPYEISMVPVPVDSGSAVRGAHGGGAMDLISQSPGDSTMTEQAPVQPAVTSPAPPAPPIVTAERAAPDVDVAAIRAEAERSVSMRIASYEPSLTAARGRLSEDAIASLREAAIRDAVSVDVLRARMWDAYLAAGAAPSVPARPETGPGVDDPATIVEAMAEAIAARAMPSYRPGGDGRHTEFMGWRPTDMISELMRARGERNIPRNPALLAERAFHSSSDFPLLLANASNKMLMAGYETANPSYRQFFARKPFRDFKAHSFLTAGDFPALLPLNEGGGIQQGTMSEKREQVTARTHARGVSVTRQMLVNDDLGAFTDFGTMIGRRISDYENALAWAVVNTASGDGPTLTEGAAAVFTTGRGNKAASGTAVTKVALGLGFAAMQKMTSLDNLKLNIQPSLLVCSPGQQFEAAVFATQVNSPSGPSGVNVFAGRYSVVSDANLADYRWYLFADPAVAPVYVYGFVGGNEAPQVRVGPQPGLDGVLVEVIHDFAVGAIDFRGGYFNSGAAPA